MAKVFSIRSNSPANRQMDFNLQQRPTSSSNQRSTPVAGTRKSHSGGGGYAINNAFTTNVAYGASYGSSPEVSKYRPSSAGGTNINRTDSAQGRTMPIHTPAVSPPITFGYARPKSAGATRPAATQRDLHGDRLDNAGRDLYSYNQSQQRLAMEQKEQEKQRLQIMELEREQQLLNKQKHKDIMKTTSSRDISNPSGNNSTTQHRQQQQQQQPVIVTPTPQVPPSYTSTRNVVTGGGIPSNADHWTTSYRMYYGNNNNNTMSTGNNNNTNTSSSSVGSTGIGSSGDSRGNIAAERFVSSSKTDINSNRPTTNNSGLVSNNPSDLLYASAAGGSASAGGRANPIASSRIRAAMDHGAKYDPIKGVQIQGQIQQQQQQQQPPSQNIISSTNNIKSNNMKKDGLTNTINHKNDNDDEVLDSDGIIIDEGIDGIRNDEEGVDDDDDDDDEMDGKPISENRSHHPEISTSTPSHSMELYHGSSNLIDFRNSSLDSLPNDRIAAAAAAQLGLSSIPNHYCSVVEAIELKKMILATKGKTGMVSSSTAVMDMYMVGKVVGVGSYGKVRAAWHRLTSSKVAIKTYDKAKLKDPSHWKRVQSEIKIMEQVSHPRIARMYEAVETPKRMHLIMECLDGGNLCSYVKAKRRLSEDESKKIFFQLLQAIEYLHAQSVIHRDVKLENVLFGDTKDIKLIDFGFSTACQQGKKLRVFCGTPSYMAPEIVRRSEYEGKPVDMWSMGILLYALLCGCFPFRAKSYPDLYRRIARGFFTIPDELSSSVRDLLRQLLALDAHNRITAMAALRHPWLQTQLLIAPDMSKLRQEYILLISEKPSEDLDEQTLQEVERFGIERDDLVRQILTKTHTAITTLYYLLRVKIIMARRVNAINTQTMNNTQRKVVGSPLKRGMSGTYTPVGLGQTPTTTTTAPTTHHHPAILIQPRQDMNTNTSNTPNFMQGVLNNGRPKSASSGRSPYNSTRPGSATATRPGIR